LNLGLFSQPFHPKEKKPSISLREDYEATVLADSLGFKEAFFGEHVTDPYETVTSCMSFIAGLAYSTQKIRLGTGTLNLPNCHPVTIASTMAMLDHMCKGRLMMGISMGALPTDWEAFDVLKNDKEAMFLEAIDQILAIWNSEAPYDLDGEFWKVSTTQTFDEELSAGEILKPFQKDGPEIVCSILDPHSKGIIKAAERGWSPMSSNFLPSKSLAKHWTGYSQGCENKGIEPNIKKWRVARMIFVTDSSADTKKYGKSVDGPYAKCIGHILKKLNKANKLHIFKENQDQPDSDVNIRYCIDKLVIAGTASEVKCQLEELEEDVGEFGTLLYVGIDWENPELARRSMELLAKEVLMAS